MSIDIEDVTTWPWGTFTCHNSDNCDNNGIAVHLQVPEDPTVHNVFCGGCGQAIEDRTAD